MRITGLPGSHVARLYGAVAPRPLRGLLAGAVSGPVTFEPARPAEPIQGPRPSLPLYTRAADKIEVEVALLGRSVDVTA